MLQTDVYRLAILKARGADRRRGGRPRPHASGALPATTERVLHTTRPSARLHDESEQFSFSASLPLSTNFLRRHPPSPPKGRSSFFFYLLKWKQMFTD
ncbi:hypothetical protein NPIL_660131 [Nephila pilipes]|uniref:Uncharacterized protein n=1 Tax=Nephila pilipes TaxID=299642 RepID=A0A8X6IJD8_NEPPI|nr:hypothetical protein NPIL_660131 [Nephila pilipes]